MKITGIKARFSKWLPRTLLGRSLLGVGVGLVILLFVAGFVVFSVWIEDNFPSDDPKRSLIPGLQKIITKPIVNAISHRVERYVRSRIESRYMNTGLTLEETIARFLDERIDIEQRRIYAYRLARAGTPEAMAALFKVFQTAGPEHKAFMLQLIGSTGNPAVKDWVWQFLTDGDERVVMAAIRGLSAIGGRDVSVKLGSLLGDSQAIGADSNRGGVGAWHNRNSRGRGRFGQGLFEDQGDRTWHGDPERPGPFSFRDRVRAHSSSVCLQRRSPLRHGWSPWRRWPIHHEARSPFCWVLPKAMLTRTCAPRRRGPSASMAATGTWHRG